ncbi:MAG: TetR/AcrR family transcriptional regulator [Candidatus Caccosoma sp.]|nr:TetR/AcrR family transcriptional regulator [Candidatus Caccosoma sp.]
MRKNIRNDRRVEKTRNAIINAFKEMIIEKDFNEITIKELAERANINRKTFYLHYESMEEILFDVTVELSEQVFESLNNKGFFNPNVIGITPLIETINELINSNYELTRKLISANSYRFFSRNIKDLIKDAVIRKIKKHIDMSEYKMNLVGDFIASGLSKLLKDWFENPLLTINEVSAFASNLIYGGIKGII